MTKENGVVVRFAPSPTGFLHVGGARTALFNYLFAKQNNGKLILRIEDTDRERSKPEYEKDILESLAWLGISFDQTFRQSDRQKTHEEYLKKLIEDGHAYISKEIPKEPGDRAEVIRFKNPGKKVKFHDLIRGEVEFDTTELKDFVIAKSMTEPIFHLAVVIDDHEMGITHVIRGEDHISNTPRQMLIQEAIGAKTPIYAHLPLILATDRSKLSKRKHGEAVSVNYYRQKGYLPEALDNFLALLGWNPGGEQEIFSMHKLIKLFQMEKIQKGGAVFNVEKLLWLNKEYIKKVPQNSVLEKIDEVLPAHFKIDGYKDVLVKIVPVIQDKIGTWSEIKNLCEQGELSYFFEAPQVPMEKLPWKGEGPQETKINLEQTLTLLAGVNEAEFTMEKVKEALWPFAEEKGRGNILWPLRVALSGREKSPDPFTLASILGKPETLARIRTATGLL